LPTLLTLYLPASLFLLRHAVGFRCPITYLKTLWSEQLSWSLISQSVKVLKRLPLVIFISMLLAPRVLRKIVWRLSSYIYYNCWLRRNSSRFLPLSLVMMLCHEEDLELESTAISVPAHLSYCMIFSIFHRSLSMCRVMSNYRLAIIISISLYIISMTTVSSSDNCFINIVSKWLLLTKMAARCFSSPAVNIFNFLGIPANLFWISLVC